MLKIQRAWASTHTKATPLPVVWQAMKGEQIQFRRGQVVMVAAAPNAGKSMFALVYAIKAQVPTLFFSADTDNTTVMIRALAHLTNRPQLTVEQQLRTDYDSYDQYIKSMSNISWVFDSSPTLDDMEMELKAYIELYGQAPELVVVDNLMNVAAETDNEWAGLREIMMNLHDMARKTEACVLVLHHVSEQSEYGSPTQPPPRRAIHGKVSQLPSVILTLGYDPTGGMLRVAPVKNRFGPHTADGSRSAALFTNFANCQIHDADAYGRAALRENQQVARYEYVQQSQRV